jgi:hypothetical protein
VRSTRRARAGRDRWTVVVAGAEESAVEDGADDEGVVMATVVNEDRSDDDDDDEGRDEETEGESAVARSANNEFCGRQYSLDSWNMSEIAIRSPGSSCAPTLGCNWVMYASLTRMSSSGYVTQTDMVPVGIGSEAKETCDRVRIHQGHEGIDERRADEKHIGSSVGHRN